MQFTEIDRKIYLSLQQTSNDNRCTMSTECCIEICFNFKGIRQVIFNCTSTEDFCEYLERKDEKGKCV